jgi:hypothetical protein
MHNLPVHVFVTWCGSAGNGPEMDRPNRAASVRAQAERQEAMMNKTDMLFVNSSVVYPRPIPGGDTCPDQDVYIQDERVVRLLVLLQQLDEAAAGLGALPKPELSEIVSSAIRLCGFADPIEARDVIAAVLDAIKQDVISTVMDVIEVQDPMSESP